MHDSTTTLTALRKAAIVISTLDGASAESLLAKMPRQAAEQVRELIADLHAIPDAEREAVLREFMQAGESGRDDSFEGVELDPGLAQKLYSIPATAAPAKTAAGPAEHSLFAFLQDTTIDALFRQLERQHPQLVAVVTAHLAPDRAADLIKRFSPRLQADLLRRVAELDVTEQEVLSDIAAELKSLLRDELRTARNRQHGLATISSILNAAGSERRAILDSLARFDGELVTDLTGRTNHPATPMTPPLATSSPVEPVTRSRQDSASQRATAPSDPPAAEVDSVDERRPWHVRTSPQPMRESASPPAARHVEFGFDELAALSDRDWQVLLRAAEPPIVLLALTGASEQMLHRITRQLSRREAQQLRERLQHPGPLRLSDIERAQQHVAELASRLMASGQIKRPERRGFAAAA